MNGCVARVNWTRGPWCLAWALILLVGCKSLDMKAPHWLPGEDDKPAVPATLSAVWTPAVMTRADGSQARGFGGRLMFFGPESQKAIRVDGALAVFAYDEQKGPNPSAEPDRRYIFTREMLASHHSKTEFGHSYSVWIPWDGVNGPTRQVSLLVRFNPTEGSTISGDLARLSLSGTSGAELATTTSTSTVQPASLQTPAAPFNSPESDAQRRMGSTTIRIPSYGQR